MATGDSCAQELLDGLLDPVVAKVDLVVEGHDLVAELDVLRLEDVDCAAQRAHDHGPLLLQGRLERVEARLELDARHGHPNRPVT